MHPYVIEGLDCAGKKTIATIVKNKIIKAGINCEVVIGPLYGGMLRRIDDWLVGLSYKKSFKFLYLLRKLIYVVEPILDGCFFRPEPEKLIIKISSHYRTWARAIIEEDKGMIKGFELGKKRHYNYMGVSLIVTDFQNRVNRHRKDKALGKTYKNENKRFFGNNADLFERWNAILEDLLLCNVSSVNLVYNNYNVNDAADLVYKHIMECLYEEGNCNDKT